MAKIAAACGSPTNRIPSGPNANGPANCRSGVPFFRLADRSAACAEPASTAIARQKPQTRPDLVNIAGSFRNNGSGDVPAATQHALLRSQNQARTGAPSNGISGTPQFERNVGKQVRHVRHPVVG